MTRKTTTVYYTLALLLLTLYASHALEDTNIPPGSGDTIKEITYKDLPLKGYLYEYVPKDSDEVKGSSFKSPTLRDDNILKESGLTKVQFLPDTFDSLGTDELDESGESDESSESSDVDASLMRYYRSGYLRYGRRVYMPYRRMYFMRRPAVPMYFARRRFYYVCSPMMGCRYVVV